MGQDLRKMEQTLQDRHRFAYRLTVSIWEHYYESGIDEVLKSSYKTLEVLYGEWTFWASASERRS